jgi:mannose-6-phosphate isomerase-like protein (cupin superfamily)
MSTVPPKPSPATRTIGGNHRFWPTKRLILKKNECDNGTAMNIGRHIDKPWGWEEILEFNDYYCIKHLFIDSGCRLSKQYHERKTETLMLVQGEAELTLGTSEAEQIVVMDIFKLFPIPPGTMHRLKANGDRGALILEVSTPELDDVVRVEDDYGRSDS